MEEGIARSETLRWKNALHICGKLEAEYGCTRQKEEDMW